MSASTIAQAQRGPTNAARVIATVRSGRALAWFAIGVVALHVADDNFLRPNAGTSAGDHLASGLVPVAILALAGAVHHRSRAGVRAGLAVTLGMFGIAFGVPGAYYLLDGSASGDHYTGLLAVIAGAVLLLSAPVTLWKARRTGGSRRRRYLRRALATALGALAAVGLAYFVVAPIAFSYGYTHIGRTGAPAELGVPHESVTITTSDGLELAASYVPSENRAAIVVFPGASAVKEARILWRNGYGVLLLDPRGQGGSQGDLVRWAGDRDLIAGAEYLRGRPDVDPGRIGGFGSSVGGEILLGAAAQSTVFSAVVSEGAGFRIGEADLTGDREAAVHTVEAPAHRLNRGLLEPPAAAAHRRRDRKHRAATGVPDLRRAGHGWRGRQAAEVLRRRRGAEVDLEGARSRAHGRHRCPPGRVRAARRRLLRPSFA